MPVKRSRKNSAAPSLNGNRRSHAASAKASQLHSRGKRLGELAASFNAIPPIEITIVCFRIGDGINCPLTRLAHSLPFQRRFS